MSSILLIVALILTIIALVQSPGNILAIALLFVELFLLAPNLVALGR